MMCSTNSSRKSKPSAAGLKQALHVVMLVALQASFLVSSGFAQRKPITRQTKIGAALKVRIARPKEYLRFVNQAGNRPAPRRGWELHEDDDLPDLTEAEQFSALRTLHAVDDPPVIEKSRPPLVKASYTPFDVTTFTGRDPMVAVGRDRVLASDGTHIALYDKSTGKPNYIWDASALFWIFTSPTIPGGSGAQNQAYVNTAMGIPADVPTKCNKDENPNDTTDGMIDEAYDVRVAYAPSRGRYIIAAALRNWTKVGGDEDCRRVAVRLVAWMIVSEDLNQIYVYRTVENNVRDFPRVTIDDDYLIIAQNGAGSDLSSIVTGFSVPDMAAGLNARSFTIKRADVAGTPKAVIPVQNFNSKEQYILFLEKADNEHDIKVWYFKKPAVRSDIFRNALMLSGAGRIGYEGRKFHNDLSGVVYHKNKIWITTHEEYVLAVGADIPGYGINLLEIPVKKANNGSLSTSVSLADGYQSYFYANSAYSYEYPAIAVNDWGDVVLSFLRYPRSSNSTEKPEVRSKVFFHDENAARGSHLVKASINPGNRRLDHLDYSWIAGDPDDNRYFWVAHSYLDGNYARKMVLQRVDINDSK